MWRNFWKNIFCDVNKCELQQCDASYTSFDENVSAFRSNYLEHMVIVKTINTQGNLYESLKGILIDFVYKWEI